ncbi:MAG: helix-turn-helix domain-containing protein, partial [Candidatus Nanopelagicales bacterium]|nr:helix-turn-helix domain-containing protein [Candidatus Nanopelagicales bacterium]
QSRITRRGQRAPPREHELGEHVSRQMLDLVMARRERELARCAQDALAPAVKAQTADAETRVTVAVSTAAASVEVPASLMPAILGALDAIAQGSGVVVVPTMRDFTTTQAAEILGVSRPHVVSLLDRGAIAYRMHGTHRRIAAQDLLTYVERMDRANSAAQ